MAESRVSLRKQKKRPPRRVRIVVIASHPALSRAITQLFSARPEFEIDKINNLRHLEGRKPKQSPALIVANVNPLGTDVSRIIGSIKRFSPISKLILICPVREFVHAAREFGADVCLEEEKLVGHLVRAAGMLLGDPKASRTGR